MNVIKISKSGVNALTDTNPKNFLVYVDQSVDHVLVKEESRDSITIDEYLNETVTHSLGYFPFVAQMVEVSSGEYQWIYNTPGAGFNPYYYYVTTNTLFIQNGDDYPRQFTYIIYYDQV